MSSYIFKSRHNSDEFFCIDNYYWPNEYWYIKKKENETWLEIKSIIQEAKDWFRTVMTAPQFHTMNHINWET